MSVLDPKVVVRALAQDLAVILEVLDDVSGPRWYSVFRSNKRTKAPIAGLPRFVFVGIE